MPGIMERAEDAGWTQSAPRRARERSMDYRTLSLMLERDKLTDLHHIRLLQGLAEDCVADIARRCQFKAFPRGAVILHQNDKTRDLLFVCHGAVRVVQYTASGREIAHAEIPAGGHFGEIAAIDGGLRSADCVAQGDTLVAILPELDFKVVLEKYPPFALAVMRGLTAIIRGINSRVRDLSVLRAPERVVAELLRLSEGAERAANGLRIRKLPTTIVLAARCGTTRETVTRTLRDLMQRGLARRAGADLDILDPAGLRELMERAVEM